MKPYVVYHFPCNDGFTAAWAVYRAKFDCEFVPQDYGKLLPKFMPDRDIYFLDFCPHVRDIWGLIKSNRVMILDHHKSAKEAIEGVDWATEDFKHNLDFNFCLDNSGAWLAWKQFMGTDSEVPKIVQYVQDRDLWRHELPGTHEAHAWLNLFPYTFDAWDEAAVVFQQNFDLVECHGRTAIQAERRVVEEIIRENCRVVQIDKTPVPTANCSKRFGSAVCEELLRKFPKAPFSAYYEDLANGMRKWGLRSRAGETDVSIIALKYNGGGHRSAAGFVTALNDDLDLERRQRESLFKL